MLGIGFFEILIIALVCFIAIGPQQLPSVMRKLAQFYRQIATLRDDLRFQVLSMDEQDRGDDKKAAAASPPIVEPDVVVPREKGQGHG